VDETLSSPLEYYAAHGPVTDPGVHAALCEVVQGVMIHRAFAELRGLYEHNGQLRVPPVIISWEGAAPRRVRPTGP
jgi:hypothetical protein